jgi:cold-inducible RNA-binding protein
MKNLFVGNIGFLITENELTPLFEPFGQIQKIQVIRDRDSGLSRGFAFVEMSNDEEAERAIAGLHGKDLEGRPLNVNEARPTSERSGNTDVRLYRQR